MGSSSREVEKRTLVDSTDDFETVRITLSSGLSSKKFTLHQKYKDGRTYLFPVFRRIGCLISDGVQRYGRGLRHSQVRNRYCSHVGDATRIDHEVHHSRCHGRYHCHLRCCRCSSHCRSTQTCSLVHSIQGLRTSWRWFGSRSQWFGGRLRYRHSGRRGRKGDSTTASTLRGNDSDPHFRRGSGSLWSDCGHLPIRKISQEHPLDSIARAWRCICLCRYARSLLFQELSERSACARVSQCFDC